MARVSIRSHIVLILGASAGMVLPPSPAALAAEPQARLEEIVVTARKRTESLQSVPISASVVSAEQLDIQDVNNVADLARVVPGLALSNDDEGGRRVAIRGLTTGTSYPTVGFYLDDVPISNGLVNTGYGGQFEPGSLEVERVEVLKGPQGTLYGASSMGGAVKFVSKQPDTSQFSGETGLELSFTEDGDPSYEVKASVNVPVVSDRLAVRIGSMYRSVGGYIDQVPNGQYEIIGSGLFTSRNTASNGDVNGLESWSNRLSAAWDIDETARVTASVFSQQTTFDDRPLFWDTLEPFQHSNIFPSGGSDDTLLPILTIEKTLGPVEVTSITSYFDRDQYQDRDFTIFVGRAVPAFDGLDSLSISHSRVGTFSQELRLGSTNESGLSYVAGLFYQDESTAMRQTVTTYGSGAATPGLAPDVTFDADTKLETQQIAAFGEVVYAMTEKLDVTLGGRYFEVDQDKSRWADGLLNGNRRTEDLNGAEETGFSPKVALSYQLSDQNLLYATVNEGYRPGNTNGTVPADRCAPDLDRLGLSAPPAAYGSDEVRNHEVGTKSDLLGGAIRLNAALFYIDWERIQQVVALPSCGFSLTMNVGTAESKGAEIEIQVSPTPALVVGLAATYNQAEITEVVPGVPTQVGDSVLNVPDWIINANGQYDFPLSGVLSGYARLDYQWRSRQLQSYAETIPIPGGSVPNPGLYQDSYGQLNLNVGIAANQWSLRFFVLNVLNDDPVRNLSASRTAPTSLTSLVPRSMGISMQYQF